MVHFHPATLTQPVRGLQAPRIPGHSAPGYRTVTSVVNGRVPAGACEVSGLTSPDRAQPSDGRMALR